MITKKGMNIKIGRFRIILKKLKTKEKKKAKSLVVNFGKHYGFKVYNIEKTARDFLIYRYFIKGYPVSKICELLETTEDHIRTVWKKIDDNIKKDCAYFGKIRSDPKRRRALTSHFRMCLFFLEEKEGSGNFRNLK